MTAPPSAMILAQLGTSALSSVADVIKHRRENPDMSGKNDSPSFNPVGLFNYNKNISVGGQKKESGLLQNVASGVGVGVGIGIGLAAGAYLFEKFVKNTEQEEVDLGGAVLDEVEA
ncbi:hypothetical protein BR93DRAFT_981570 [Coniochaeta sp. PMI_546]|nr:hypothetical protein BR93DRAFT_981570 [Coniochaeta sp. PMI_546]